MKGKLGRPPGRKKGARKAVTEIVALRAQAKLSESQLAARVGLNQSTVNRLLSGDEPRWTPALRKLCDYARKTLKPSLLRRSYGPTSERKLSSAITRLWDGTTADADRLLRLLDAVIEIRQETVQRTPENRRDRKKN